jgi:hypothetical protein|uniref:TF-B3 domain-containing protein n=1 Tax=Fagus sylvatica TaxID=28930 RepID=A0A2N9J3W5_FAGSY
MFVLKFQAIPQKFVDNLKKKLPQSVTLKGPSGLTWNVDLTTNDDTLFFNHGWQEFVQDHSLKETDLLVFRYDGGSQFDVLIFDGNNLCEKGASYFVRKREHTEHDTGCIKKKLRKGSIDDVLTPSLTANKRTWQNARQCVGSKEPATTGKSLPKFVLSDYNDDSDFLSKGLKLVL